MLKFFRQLAKEFIEASLCDKAMFLLIACLMIWTLFSALIFAKLLLTPWEV